MPLPNLSIDEIIQTARHSSLPTVFCEGKTDLTVLRHLENLLDPSSVSFFPCGGRDVLLSVFERRGEINGQPFSFLADQDTWIFAKPPRKYKGILFTWGYSIENDLLDGSRLDQLLDRNEEKRFQRALKEVIRWYAFEINKLPADANVNVHVSQLLEDDRENLFPTFLRVIQFEEAPAALVERISASYKRLLRGKSLAELLIRFLSHSSRQSKYQYVNLWEMSVRLFDNKRLSRIVRRLRVALNMN